MSGRSARTSFPAWPIDAKWQGTTARPPAGAVSILGFKSHGALRHVIELLLSQGLPGLLPQTLQFRKRGVFCVRADEWRRTHNLDPYCFRPILRPFDPNK